ncbi:MAG: peptidoglycan D,D-transpeptidase FtsI family protein [Myxococcota bacterium]
MRQRRLLWIACAAGAIYLGLGLRAVQLQELDAEFLAARARSQHRTTLRQSVLRGDITDRFQMPLAQSATVRSVAASPRLLRDPDRVGARLARALGVDRARVQSQLRRNRSFVWIRRWVSPEAADRVERLDLPGVQLLPERRRFYPNGELAARYLGFAGRDEVGLSGLELEFESLLRRSPQRLAVQRDERGRKLVAHPATLRSRSVPRLVLALDGQIQHVAERALDRALERTGAAHGTLIALDPRNGDVLALAERPAFDPNRFWEARPDQYRSGAFVDSFEPGSTLKPFGVAIALEAGVVRPESRFDCEHGRWRVGDRTIRDTRPHGILSVSDIVRLSSNIGAAKIGDRLGSLRLVEGLRRLGFGSRTGSGYPGEAAGHVRSLRESQVVQRANLAFGQGIRVTPLQLATAGAVLASGGRRVTPRLALRLIAGADSLEWPSGLGERILSRGTAEAVVEMMVDVVERGTGRRARIAGTRIAGKTGTAQKVVDGSYSHDHLVASFLGIAPAERPQFVIAVVIDEPRGPKGGGAVAAPVFREVARFALDRYGPGSTGAE